MTTFSTLTLHFGADGLPDEPPLSFEAAPVNLIVGPNNAGKSLFLRELYGSDPRQDGWHSKDISERHVVADAAWDRETLHAHQRELQLSQYSEDDSIFGPTRHLEWGALLEALRSGEQTLLETQGELLDALKRAAAELLDKSTQQLLVFAEFSNDKSIVKLFAGVAVYRLAVARHQLGILVDEGGEEMLSPEQLEQLKRLRREQELLEAPLRAALRRCLSVLEDMGHDVIGLDLDSLLELEGVFVLVVQWMRQQPMLANFFEQVTLPDDMPPPDKELRRRLMQLWSWQSVLLDPSPLRRLRQRLEKDLGKRMWASEGGRQAMRENALFLDGLQRLTMVASGQARGYGQHSPGEPPVLQLLDDPERRAQLRGLVHDALGQHLVVDGVTHAPTVHFRLAQDDPDGLEHQRTAEAAAYLDAAAPLAQRSDGIHAYIGMLAAVVAGEKRLVFIDEPEAFLHPPLARRLATQLCKLAASEGRQLFIATHSADFLAACATSGVPVNVLRLSYDGERATARLLDGDGLRRLALDPRLRSSHPLSSLFCDGAVVCEGDRDRALYEEINTRLWSSPGTAREGVESCTFLHAESWQSERFLIAPLRRMGVAAAAVVDLDAIFGDELDRLMRAAQIPDRQRKAIRNLAKDVKHSVTVKHPPKCEERKYPKLDGELLAQLDDEDRQDVMKVIQDLAVFGVFVVPVGEVEDWFGEAGIEASKGRWLGEVWQHLGWDPESPDYMHPQEGDIWDFMRQIAAWIQNPERRGTSAQSL